MKAKKSPPTRKKGTSKTNEKAPPKHLDMPPKQLKRQDEHKRKKPYWAKHVTIVTSIWQKMQRSFLRTWLGLDYWTISWRSCWILEPTEKSSRNTKTARNIGGILDGSEVHPLNQPQVRWCLKIWGRIGFQPLNEPTSGSSIFGRLDDLGALGAFKTRREMHYPLQIASQVSISCYIETEQYFIDKKRNPGISVQIYASCFHVSCCFWNKK